jgi:hypothetical protein
MESQNNTVMFRYNNKIKERQLIPVKPDINKIINHKRLVLNTDYPEI